jgi:hypothetical protein
MAPATDVSLLTAITFHYVEARLPFLARVAAEQPSLGGRVRVRVFTNTADPSERALVEDAFPARTPSFDLRVVSVPPQAHPYFLPWAHKEALRGEFTSDASLTHFLYLEDDLLVRRENLDYWREAREELRPLGLLPGFLRIERREATGEWYATDLLRPVRPWRDRPVRAPGGHLYLQLRNPYQGTYVLDRELAAAHLSGPAARPDFGEWKIREQAAQGETFVDVPPGYRSRSVVRWDPSARTVPPACRIHHLPDNYANDPASRHARIPLDRIVRLPGLVELLARR